MNMQIDDHILTVDTHTEELPRLPKPATVTVWQVPTEYVESGYFVAVRTPSEPETIPACAATDAILLGSLELPAHPDAQLTASKQERLAIINDACNEALLFLAQTYPDGEVSSWPQQIKEAEALTADPNAAAPLLSSVATARNITLSDLAGRVLAKASAYSLAAGQIIGKRQALEDALDVAETAEMVSAIAW